MKEIEYIQVGDYLLPNLKVEEIHLNRFGRAKLDYLKKHDYGLYFKLLTKNELKILHYLVLNQGKIVTREEIMNYLWESENFIDDNTLTVNMTRLRGKLEELGIKDSIETKRGQGYILK